MPADAPAGDRHVAAAAPVILIVDDNAGKRLALRAMLAMLGCSIVEADSGRAALRLVLKQTFALILMDVRMPTMDGYETARLIRQHTETSLTPIIFVTAYSREDTEVAAAYSTGPVDFIFVPVAPDILRAKVSTFTQLFLKTQELQASLASITALTGKLLESEVRSHAVLQNVGDGIVTVNDAGRIESLNRSAQQMFGYLEHEVVGQPLELIVEHGENTVSGPTWAGEELITLPRIAGVRVEAVGRRHDGSSFQAEADVSQMRIGDRQVTIACIRDISDRVEAARREQQRGETLRREAQRDRAAFEEAPTGSIIATSDGQILRVNQAICTMTGYQAEELIGTHFLDLTHPDDRGKAERVAESVLSGTNSTVRYEKRYVVRDGSILEACVAVTAIHDDGKKVAQLYAQIVDVTEVRRTARELERAQVEVLDRLAAAAEFRDDDTGQHTRRVGDLSVAIAQAMDLPTTQVGLIRLAAPLHDLGKIAIPDAILGKAGKLTHDEFDQMKAHTTIGATLLAGGAYPLLEMAEQIALTHHENWDGSGYPAGLVRGAIPIAGRIVAVADVFDALTHSRPYKSAWTTEEAITEITSQTGQQFDPDVVAALLSALEELAADTGMSPISASMSSTNGHPKRPASSVPTEPLPRI